MKMEFVCKCLKTEFQEIITRKCYKQEYAYKVPNWRYQNDLYENVINKYLHISFQIGDIKMAYMKML